jgi:hexosaminidase
LNLLPHPRSSKLKPGKFILPARATLQLDASLKPDEARAIAKRLESAAKEIGVELISRSAAVGKAPAAAHNIGGGASVLASRLVSSLAPPAAAGSANTAALQSEFYTLTIDQRGVLIEFREAGGLRAGVATLRQIFREHGRRLPCLKIRDWPDFPGRGVMLDISRGRVPKLKTLLELADHLADFKINELQLYTEHTFAYRKYKSVWQSWGALTAAEIRKLDARCRELGIDLVPNQNSFGHLRYFLEHPRLKKLAEVSAPYEDASGEFLRRPTTLAPNHPDTLPFLRGLYDELLPNFSSKFFNVGCDETWDLGRGQSKKLCEQFGKGRVYLDFLKKIHRKVSARGKRMMFWGDIILHHPTLIKELPRDLIALNWGYEANHPFDREAARFAKARIPFYVCPGTSTWMTLIGRHDNGLANLRTAAKIGKKFGAIGYLNTDWGDGGHPQPLAVSWPLFLAGAALSWNAKNFDESQLLPVLSRDVFYDPSQRLAKAAFALGFAHRKLNYFAPNSTPLGSVISSPKPEDRELFCRDGLKCFAKISEAKIRAALKEIETQRSVLSRSKPETEPGKVLALELDLAARMAAQSCKFMLWQHALVSGKDSTAKDLAKIGIKELAELERDFESYWPLRNKASTKNCSPFLRWRMKDYRDGVLPAQPKRNKPID